MSPIKGAANLTNTANYFKEIARSQPHYNKSTWYFQPPGVNFFVSRIGFGTYRTDLGVQVHFDALREALISGTNVIDTAANFNNGGAEKLVGSVLAELIKANRIKREQIVIISKAGYIEGKEIQKLQENRERYGEVNEYSPGSFHSIDPEFLRSQIEQSLERLNLETLDVFLLQNPENFLKSARFSRQSPEKARREFEKKLQVTFTSLEDLVNKGKIQYYGIVSNTFTVLPEDPIFLDLENIIEFAPPHFRVLQFPGNLLECDFKFNRNISGKTLCENTAQASIWTMTNRPLNAMAPGKGLFKLARLIEPPVDQGASTIAEMKRLIAELEDNEKKLVNILQDKHFIFNQRAPACSEIIKQNKNSFSSREHFTRAMMTITALIQRSVNIIHALIDSEQGRYRIENYSRLCNAALGTWQKFVTLRYHERLAPLERVLGELSPSLSGKSLAEQAVMFLLAAKCPDTVLVGMRSVGYVRNMNRIYSAKLPAEAEQLNILSRSSGIIDRIIASLPGF